MAEQKPELGKGNYIEYADDAVKPDAKGNGSNFLSYADAPTAKSGYVPKTELEKNNYGVYRDTPYEPGGETIPPNHVTVSLTNPVGATKFQQCEIFSSETGAIDDSGFRPTYAVGELLATISSASGQAEFEVPVDMYGIVVRITGAVKQPTVSQTNVTCTGDVQYIGTLVASLGTTVLFEVTGDGTVTLNGLDYSD